MEDIKVTDIDKDGNFVDKNGVQQKAVSLDAIFGMVGNGGKGPSPKPKINNGRPQQTPTPKQFKGKKKPTRGINF